MKTVRENTPEPRQAAHVAERRRAGDPSPRRAPHASGVALGKPAVSPLSAPAPPIPLPTPSLHPPALRRGPTSPRTCQDAWA